MSRKKHAAIVELLLSIEKYSCIDGEDDTVAKKLLSLTVWLNADPLDGSLSEVTRAQMILRLKPLLHHRSVPVVVNVVNLLIALTEDSSHIPSEVVLALMRASGPLCASCETGACILQLLTNLIYDNEANKKLLQSSGCLDHILLNFCNMELKMCDSVDHFSYMVDFLLVAAENAGSKATDNQIKKKIADIVIPKVVCYLRMWNSSPSTTAVADNILKELLFFCRNVISCLQIYQDIFLECGGLKTLIRALEETDLIQEHMLIQAPSRKSQLIDVSPTLFTSLVLLMDASVTHNARACDEAVQLNAIELMQSYLRIAPVEHKIFIIPSIVHLVESGIVDVNFDLWKEMFAIVCNSKPNTIGIETPILHFIEEKMERAPAASVEKITKFGKGTPHPNKKFSLKNKRLLKRLVQSSPKLSDTSPKLYSKASSNFQVLSPISSEVHAGSAMNLAMAELKVKPHAPLHLPKPSTYFMNTAELIIFMKCIKIHGINMENVRRIFPSHKELTESDLYALWRAIWKKKWN